MDRITFHSNRDTFLEKVEKVISLTLEKLLELNATRGLITAATSDLDVEIENMVMLLIEKRGISKEELDNHVNINVVLPMEKRLESFWDKYESFQDYFHKIDAVRKWSIFRDLLKPLNSNQEIKSFLIANKNYQIEVIDIRNKFAHAKAEVNENKVTLKGQLGKGDFEFDQDACIRIRRNLIIHRTTFKNLKLILNQLQ